MKRNEGVDLDLAILEAVYPYCSVSFDVDGIDGPAVWKWNGDRNYVPLPSFSSHLNFALCAAVEVGLFNPDRFFESSEREYLGELMWRGETPSLSICAAILEQKKVSEESDET